MAVTVPAPLAVPDWRVTCATPLELVTAVPRVGEMTPAALLTVKVTKVFGESLLVASFTVAETVR